VHSAIQTEAASSPCKGWLFCYQILYFAKRAMPIDGLNPYQPRAGRQQVYGSRGFTLIELIIVIVLLGILAIYAAPRIFNMDDFNARGFHDQTLALLHTAQKSAIAQRRTVCVAFTTTTATLTMASTPATTNCATAVTMSGTTQITAKSNVNYGTSAAPAAPTDFNFNGLGQPIDNTGAALPQLTIKISNAANVVVETGSGYAHD
jgi:MSHA pilin protein MshC